MLHKGYLSSISFLCSWSTWNKKVILVPKKTRIVNKLPTECVKTYNAILLPNNTKDSIRQIPLKLNFKNLLFFIKLSLLLVSQWEFGKMQRDYKAIKLTHSHNQITDRILWRLQLQFVNNKIIFSFRCQKVPLRHKSH